MPGCSPSAASCGCNMYSMHSVYQPASGPPTNHPPTEASARAGEGGWAGEPNIRQGSRGRSIGRYWTNSLKRQGVGGRRSLVHPRGQQHYPTTALNRSGGVVYLGSGLLAGGVVYVRQPPTDPWGGVAQTLPLVDPAACRYKSAISLKSASCMYANASYRPSAAPKVPARPGIPGVTPRLNRTSLLLRPVWVVSACHWQASRHWL